MKKTYIKRLLAFALSIIMLLGLMPMSAFATDWDLTFYDWEYLGVPKPEKSVTILLSELTEGASGDGWTYENETLTFSEANYAYTLEGGTFNGILKNYGLIENATVKAIAQDDGSFIGGVTYNYGAVLGGSYEDMHNYGTVDGWTSVFREIFEYGDTPAYLYNYEGGKINGGTCQRVVDKGGSVDFISHLCYKSDCNEYYYVESRYLDENTHVVYGSEKDTQNGERMDHICDIRLMEHIRCESGEFENYCYSDESKTHCGFYLPEEQHAVCGNADCSADHNFDGLPDEHDDVSWQYVHGLDYDSSDSDAVQLDTGNYHFIDVYRLDWAYTTVNATGNISLCISDGLLTYMGTTSRYDTCFLMDVAEDVTVNLCTCTGSAGLRSNPNIKGTLNVYEGITIESGGSIVVEEGGTLNIYGATICVSSIENHGTVNIYGGKINGYQLGIQNYGTGTVRLFGDVQISCNEEPDFGEDWNSGLYLEPGSKLYVDKLTPNSKINLGVLGFGEFTIEGGADYIDCFYGVSDEQFAVADNGEDLISRRLSPITLEYSGVYGTDFSYTQEVYVVKGNDVPKPDFLTSEYTIVKVYDQIFGDFAGTDLKDIPTERGATVSVEVVKTYHALVGQTFDPWKLCERPTTDMDITYNVEEERSDGSVVVNGSEVKATGTGYVWLQAIESDTGRLVTSDLLCIRITNAFPTSEDFVLTPPANLTYDGNKKSATVSTKPAVIGMGSPTVCYYRDADLTDMVDGTPVDAGSYFVAIDVAEGENYAEISKLLLGSFEIKQKEIGISWGATRFLPYDTTSKVPNASATGLAEGDTCTLTTEVVENDDGAGIIPGTWTAKVTALSNPNYKLPESGERVSVQFEIINGYQNNAPIVSGINETIFGKADGKITGVDSTMEFRRDGEDTYAAINGTEVTDLAAGKYYVRYTAKTYYNPSPDAVVVINTGGKLKVTIPQNQVGYTLTVDKTELNYNDTVTISFKFNEGYTPTDDFVAMYNNSPLPLRDNNQVIMEDCTEDIVITVDGIQDTAYPMAEISIKDNKWTEFWNNLTFGLFFNDTQDVTIASADKGSGVSAVYYYLADRELQYNEAKTITNWQEYNGTFKINPDNKYVIYVKVVDNEGNTSYINSIGIVLDKIAPVLVGIANGEAYYGDKRFKALDDYLLSLKVDGVDVTAELNGDNEYKIIADNAEHTITAIDEAGNVTEYKITVCKNYTVTYKVDGEIVDTQTVGYGKDAVAPNVPKKDGYVGKWDNVGNDITADTVINGIYTEIAEVIPEQVEPDDKTELEDTKKQLEDMLDDDDYTEDDKKVIQDAIDSVDVALKIIENVENVEEFINKIPENITKNDEAAIRTADDAYNALSDYEKSLVEEDTKKILDDAKAAFAELNKPADTDSPQTGDNSNLWLWFALLFVSGAAILGITVYDHKRKVTSKR